MKAVLRTLAKCAGEFLVRGRRAERLEGDQEPAWWL
ncbi:MAG: hypothetical protein AB1631_21745 [Acidobacteriota bacterium]